MLLNKELEYNSNIVNLKVWPLSDFFLRMEITDSENFKRWSQTFTKAFFDRVAFSSSIRDPRALYDLIIKGFKGSVNVTYHIQSEKDLNVDERGNLFVLMKFDKIIKLTVPFPLAENPLTSEEYISIIRELRNQLGKQQEESDKHLAEELRKQRNAFNKERKDLRKTVQDLNRIIDQKEDQIFQLQQMKQQSHEKKKPSTKVQSKAKKDAYAMSFLDRQKYLDSIKTDKNAQAKTYTALSLATNIRKKSPQMHTSSPVKKQSPKRNTKLSLTDNYFDSWDYM